jgi:hypothetical protein
LILIFKYAKKTSMLSCRKFKILWVVAIMFIIGTAQAGLVVLSTNVQYQTIRGWVGVCGVGLLPPAFQQQQLVTRCVNELGVTTLRLDLPFNGNNATQGHSWTARIDHTNPSKTNWANFDSLAGVQYDFTATDQLMSNTVVPFRQLVLARGDPFVMYDNPSFYYGGSTGPMPTWIQYNTGEYAEYLVSLAEYLAHKYGLAPDYLTIMNEAGNNNAMTPAFEARVIKAVGPMLAAAGLNTKVQLAECVNAVNALTYVQDTNLTSDVLQFVATVSWHDYGTQNSAAKASIFSYAQSNHLQTAETETQLATFQTMYDDLVNGGNSYWGQYFLGGNSAGAGIQYLNTGLDGASMSLPSQYWNWRQVMNYVRPGAVRIGATSTDNSVLAMAFVNNGRPTVVLCNTNSTNTSIAMTVSNLPAGIYGVSESTGGVGITELGLQTVTTGTLTVTDLYNGVLTIYPYPGTNMPPEIFSYGANPAYLKTGAGTSTVLTAAATDSELNNLTYTWSVATKPAGANVTLVNSNSASTTANGLSLAGFYQFNVSVSDGVNNVTKPVGFNVLVGNQPPIIDVVQSRSPLGLTNQLLLTLPQNSTWLLDQVAYDLEGNTLAYNWTTVSQPAGASVSLLTPSANNCIATNLNVAGNYDFRVTVRDGTTPVSEDVIVTVDPPNLHAPTIANAAGGYVSPGHGHLSATTSDADGDWIANWWDVISKPAGATVMFADPASPTTDFYVSTAGNYVFQLSTVDRSLWTQSANISVTITNALIQIISIKPQGSDVLISWLAGPGNTNILQAAPKANGIYTNTSPNLIIPDSGITNYLDVGALTNWPDRFYRVQLVP